MWNVRRVKLRAGLADRLGRDDPHRRPFLDQLPGAHVPAVALGTHAERAVAGQRASDPDRVQAQRLDLGRRSRA